MKKMLKNSSGIVAALMLLQTITCSAKVLSLYGDSTDAKLWRHFDVDLNQEVKDTEYRSGMNWTEYQDVEVIYDFMQELNKKFPKITQLSIIGKTYEGRDLKVLRISENPEENKKIWIDGGIHAREWVSPATITNIMHQLLSNWQSQPEYIKQITWYFMPVMNPDGYVYSRKEDRDWRKNRSPTSDPDCFGVDLNRNFDIGWATIGSSSNLCSELYHGPSAGSELETQAVTKFLLKNKKNLVSYLTYHSYSQVLIYPWSYKYENVEDAADLLRVGDLAAQRIKEKTGYVYTPVSGFEFGAAGGGSDDWSRKALDAKYVYTVELRDEGKHGFELPPDQIIPTAQEGFIVVYTVAEAVGA